MCCSIKVMPVNFVCRNSLLSGIVSNDNPVKVSGVSSCQFALCGEGLSVVVDSAAVIYGGADITDDCMKKITGK